MSVSNNNNNHPNRTKGIFSRLIKASPSPPQLLFLAILGVYYHFLSIHHQENPRQRVVDGVLVAHTPSAEAQLTKARYDFYFFVAMGASFAFSALYYGADMFSGLWALVDAASPLLNPSAKHTAAESASACAIASDPDVSESDEAASQAQGQGQISDSGTVCGAVGPSRARKAAVNASLALPVSVMGVYAGWIRYDHQVEELQKALEASGV